ncbi:MAG: CerR family C-terminal domain-containing protein [Pirellulaceae bacterium]|jgi:AcrR family transcriptional regulator|nr:CerR family C-terminal domain-containing protein [Pirellulaceae bacterium]
MAGADVPTRLLQAAGRVFADKGYQAATVRDICAEAGVNVASVNYYFGDKSALYVAVLTRARQVRAERYPLPRWSPGTSADERLRDFIGVMLQRMVAAPESGWNTRLMLREVLEPTGFCDRLVQQYFRPLFEILVGILRELLPEGTPGHVVHQVGFSVIGQCLYYRVAQPVLALLVPTEERAAWFQPQQLADHITRMTLAALGAGPTLKELDASAPDAGCVPADAGPARDGAACVFDAPLLQRAEPLLSVDDVDH